MPFGTVALVAVNTIPLLKEIDNGELRGYDRRKLRGRSSA